MLRGLLIQNPGNHHFSMRLRLTLWITLIVTIVLWVKSSIFWLYLERSTAQLELRTHTQMSKTLASQISLLLPDVSGQELDELKEQALRSIYFESVYLDVYRVNGESLIPGRRSLLSTDEEVFRESLETIEPVSIDNQEIISRINEELTDINIRYAQLEQVLGRDGVPYVMLFASANRYSSNQFAIARGVLRAALMISPLVGFVSGWFISGIAVAPITRAQQLIQKMGPENLRGDVDYRANTSEVDELAHEVEAARARIRAAFESQERFLANVSHEIKTPIAVMLVESQTLNTDGLPEDVEYFVESVQDEMKRLGNLVESFLTLTRLEDGQDRSQGKQESVNELAMESVEHCTPMARQQGVRLTLTLLDGESTMDVSVLGVAELLVTMLDNLIRNAIRFSKTDDEIEISLACGESMVDLIVRDHGPGIPEDRIDKIFDRFSQGGNEREGRGHGLGLTIAQGIAELHRGTISVRNMNPGCEFMVSLPVSAR